MDQKQLVLQLSRKSLPYQIIKYILLVLNIMIVTTTAIVTIIICLLPRIIYEKKLAVESALNFFETGNLLPHKKHDPNASDSPTDLSDLAAHEIDTIRLIRYVILGLSACIILNQTLAVYGLFRERTCHILSSSTFIGLVGQLSLFVLPASIFMLIILYLTFSIGYVILLAHLNSQAKQPPPRALSRAGSVEPCSSRGCCCRCKGCLCISPPPAPMMMATINPNRKTSMPMSTQSYQNAPYYYGSLGRKSRETKAYLSQLQAMKPPEPPLSDIYAQRTAPRTMNTATLRPSNKFSNLSMDSKNIYGTTIRRDSTGYNNYLNFERSKNSTMI